MLQSVDTALNPRNDRQCGCKPGQSSNSKAEPAQNPSDPWFQKQTPVVPPTRHPKPKKAMAQNVHISWTLNPKSKKHHNIMSHIVRGTLNRNLTTLYNRKPTPRNSKCQPTATSTLHNPPPSTPKPPNPTRLPAPPPPSPPPPPPPP